MKIASPARWALSALLFLTIDVSSTANAALVSSLSGLAYYDDIANLTWLADANYAKTTGYDDIGVMTWSDAGNWASGLEVVGVTGWRLPDSDACSGEDCTGSKMGNLFYNALGGSGGSPITTTRNGNHDLFSNVQAYYYWSGTTSATNRAFAWFFGYQDGGQYRGVKTDPGYAWAVKSGDVAPAPVPAAMWLFGSVLIGLVGLAKRKWRRRLL